MYLTIIHFNHKIKSFGFRLMYIYSFVVIFIDTILHLCSIENTIPFGFVNIPNQFSCTVHDFFRTTLLKLYYDVIRSYFRSDIFVYGLRETSASIWMYIAKSIYLISELDMSKDPLKFHQFFVKLSSCAESSL